MKRIHLKCLGILCPAWLAIISAISFSGCSAPSESDQLGPLEGAWQMTGHVSVAADGTSTINKPQESLFLFRGGHYSMAFARGEEQSPAYAERFTPTDEEKAARMSSITVNTGTYTVSESTATLRPMFALVPEFVGGSLELGYELSGDVLTLKWRLVRSADGMKQPYTAAGNSIEITLIRIQ